MLRVGGQRMQGARPDALRFLVLADLTPENDLVLVIEAFSDLLRWHPTASLIVVGEGPERSTLERTISHLGIADHVGLPGAVPQSRLVELLQRTHVFVVPRRAGCPRTVPPALPVAMAGGLCRDRERGRPGREAAPRRPGRPARAAEQRGLAAACHAPRRRASGAAGPTRRARRQVGARQPAERVARDPRYFAFFGVSWSPSMARVMYTSSPIPPGLAMAVMP